jgi:phosphatidylcholine synthase
LTAIKAYAVHVLTASGIVFLFLAFVELVQPEPRAWLVFVYFIAATIVDAIDGPLARAWGTKVHAKAVDGRTIDDIVDYVGFTFLPLALVWRLGWLPGDGVGTAVVCVALVASLLGFANVHAKDEARGFFRGFPSYWNLVAFYLGLVATHLPGAGPWINAVVVLALALLTVLPVWFVYPNLAPRKWKPVVMIGALVWLLAIVVMLPFYPDRVPAWATVVTLIYPLFYTLLSVSLYKSWPPGENEPSRVGFSPPSVA